jgi:hypothetical protein
MSKCALLTSPPFFSRALGEDIDLAPNNGFDTVFLDRLVELNGTKEIAMIRHRYGRHPELFGTMGQAIDGDRPIQEAIIGVNVEMDKRNVLHGALK